MLAKLQLYNQCGDKNGNESDSDAKKMANIPMCIQLVRQYLKSSIEYFLEDSFSKFVG